MIKTIFLSLLISTSAWATDFGKCNSFFPGGKAPTLNIPDTKPLCFNDFAILYSVKTKSPIYCVERLSYLTTKHNKLKRSNHFHEEPMLKQSERSTLKDYQNSGYDRGHICPAQFRRNEVAMEESFSLANMVPQTKNSNRKVWNKNVETPTLKYIKKNSVGDVYVFTGPIYSKNPKTIGRNKVAVPEHLFKVVYDAGKKKSWVHWISNSDDAKMVPPITYEEFKKRSGLNLLGQ
ncbi:MAG: DNA/RNA non-specific endonuclease [Bdellovibrionaceae bacterium]|nr:DNA/RNA non-specific endonuclease [Pseudobdellovibrionaceae bacterium]